MKLSSRYVSVSKASPCFALLCSGRFIVIGLAVLLCFPPTTYAGRRRGEPSPCPFNACKIRACDEVWLVSTRHLGQCGDQCSCDCPDFEFFRLRRNCPDWEPSTAADFFATDNPDVLTTVVVHGNRMTPEWVNDRGFKTYCDFSCHSDRPIRHVVWSWPSEPIPQTRAIVLDAQVKASRTPLQSFYLGCFLSRIQPNVAVGILGYSYGSRVIVGAMHALGGGCIAGRQLPNAGFPVVQPRIALWAAACDSTGLVPGSKYGQTLHAISAGLILVNHVDPVLRRYDRSIPDACSKALGFAGVPNCNLGQLGCRIQQLDVTNVISRRHQWDRYFESPCVMATTRRYVLWQ